MERRPFDVDPLSGAVETFYFDHTNDTFTIERVEDAEPLLEMNKAIQSATPGNWRGALHRVASIPNSLLPELEKQGIMTSAGRILDAKKLRQWLNDPDNRFFRTRLGRV